jgi:hypothetical protein
MILIEFYDTVANAVLEFNYALRTVDNTSGRTLWTLYRSYFNGIRANCNVLFIGTVNSTSHYILAVRY